MSTKPKTEHKKYSRISILEAVVSFAVPMLFFVIIGLKFGFVYDANDDRFISEIMSGNLLGYSSFHAVHPKFWVTFPITCLYKMFPGMPWWGGFLIFMTVVSFALIFKAVLEYQREHCSCKNEEGTKKNRAARTVLAYVVATMLCLGLMGFCFRAERQIQFTSTAIMLASAGYTFFILRKFDRKTVILFALTELLAFSIRDTGMLIVQPIGIAFYFGLMLIRKDYNIKRGLALVGSIVAVMLMGFFGKVISGEMSDEWKEFYAFNTMRAEFYDFKGIPEYDEIKSIAEKYGVSEREWQAFKGYYLADRTRNYSFDKELLAYAKSGKGGGSISILPGEGKRGLLQILLFAGSALICILTGRKCKYLIPFCGLALAHCVVWGYINYRGRLLPRVTVPLLFAESVMIITLVIIVFGDILKEQKKSFSFINALLSAALLLYTLTGLYVAKKDYDSIANLYDVHIILDESFEEVEQYCNSHPDNKYLLDLDTFSFAVGFPLSNRHARYNNYRMAGGWFTGTKEFSAGLQKYLEGAEAVYYIVPKYEEYDRMSLDAAQYIINKCGYEPEEVDSFDVLSGGRYLVYRIPGNIY